MSELTICVECRHHYRKSPSPIAGTAGGAHRCYAPWPQKLNLVTGVYEPTDVDCRDKNRAGDCEHFERQPYVALWRRCITAVLDFALLPKKSPTL